MEQKDEPIKFHRPPNNDEFKQSKKEKDMMAYVVLFQCSNPTAFAFFNPEVCDKSGKLNKAGQSLCRQFFSHPNNIAYMDALREHLAALMKGARIVTNDTIDDTRKDNALKSLLNQAMSLVEKGEDLDAESLKIVAEIFRKLNLIGEDVETEIRPLRFLPQRCSSCRMRIFVESAVADGSVLDMCSFCKCRKVAEENGYKFDEKDLLDIPKEIIEQIEAKNNVSVIDIISGKVPN